MKVVVPEAPGQLRAPPSANAAQQSVSTAKVMSSPAVPTAKQHVWTIDEWVGRLRETYGLEAVDLGQGRGGECQFICLLFAHNRSKFKKMKSGRWEPQEVRVDDFRLQLAAWIRRHGDFRYFDVSGKGQGSCLKDLALISRSGLRGKTPEQKWESYIKGIQKGDWGDHFTLLAAADILRRQVVTFSFSRASKALVSEVVWPPAEWDVNPPELSPIFLAHISEVHYLALLSTKEVRAPSSPLRKDPAELVAEHPTAGAHAPPHLCHADETSDSSVRTSHSQRRSLRSSRCSEDGRCRLRPHPVSTPILSGPLPLQAASFAGPLCPGLPSLACSHSFCSTGTPSLQPRGYCSFPPDLVESF